MPPAHLERRGSAPIESARRGFEPHQSGPAHLALCCHTYAAMRSRGNKQKAYVQASFLLSRRDDHLEGDGAGFGTGLGTRDHHARGTWRVLAGDELRALPCRRPRRYQPRRLRPSERSLADTRSKALPRLWRRAFPPAIRTCRSSSSRLRTWARSSSICNPFSSNSTCRAGLALIATDCGPLLRVRFAQDSSFDVILDPRQHPAASMCHLSMSVDGWLAN